MPQNVVCAICGKTRQIHIIRPPERFREPHAARKRRYPAGAAICWGHMVIPDSRTDDWPRADDPQQMAEFEAWTQACRGRGPWTLPNGSVCQPWRKKKAKTAAVG